MKNSLLLLSTVGVCAFLMGCSPDKEPVAKQAEIASLVQAQSLAIVVPQHDQHSARNSLDWIGIYQGVLPCADCSGIHVSLTINANGTYQRVEDYQGENGGIFNTQGKFEWNPTGSIIALYQNDAPMTYYHVQENALQQLDQSGKSMTGALSSLYVLNKQ